MKTKGLKIINKKSQNNSYFLSKYKVSEVVQCIGNLDQFNHFIAVPKKFYMTIEESNEKEAKRKYYKNKIKSI
jgi:hypothetical protein